MSVYPEDQSCEAQGYVANRRSTAVLLASGHSSEQPSIAWHEGREAYLAQLAKRLIRPLWMRGLTMLAHRFSVTPRKFRSQSADALV